MFHRKKYLYLYRKRKLIHPFTKSLIITKEWDELSALKYMLWNFFFLLSFSLPSFLSPSHSFLPSLSSFFLPSFKFILKEINYWPSHHTAKGIYILKSSPFYFLFSTPFLLKGLNFYFSLDILISILFYLAQLCTLSNDNYILFSISRHLHCKGFQVIFLFCLNWSVLIQPFLTSCNSIKTLFNTQ